MGKEPETLHSNRHGTFITLSISFNAFVKDGAIVRSVYDRNIQDWFIIRLMKIMLTALILISRIMSY